MQHPFQITNSYVQKKGLPQISFCGDIAPNKSSEQLVSPHTLFKVVDQAADPVRRSRSPIAFEERHSTNKTGAWRREPTTFPKEPASTSATIPAKPFYTQETMTMIPSFQSNASLLPNLPPSCLQSQRNRFSVRLNQHHSNVSGTGFTRYTNKAPSPTPSPIYDPLLPLILESIPSPSKAQLLGVATKIRYLP